MDKKGNINIENDGFNMKNFFGDYDSLNGLKDLALISLKSALIGYFSTYKAVSDNFTNLEKMYENKNNDKRCDSISDNYSSEYCRFYTSTICNFHNFAELVCKEFLREENELLVVQIKGKKSPRLRIQSIKDNELTYNNLKNTNTIAFGETINILQYIIKKYENKKSELITNRSKYEFINNHLNTLNKLNLLRNKLCHRGTFILDYSKLDEFIGQSILPFVKDVLDMKPYKNVKELWKYKPLFCKIDPFKKIIEKYKSNSYNTVNIALFKELGRAAYSNPLRNRPNFDYYNNVGSRRRAIVESNSFGGNEADIFDCPVCGNYSLVKYKQSFIDEDEEYISKYKCTCCSFEFIRPLKIENVNELNNYLDWEV